MGEQTAEKEDIGMDTIPPTQDALDYLVSKALGSDSADEQRVREAEALIWEALSARTETDHDSEVERLRREHNAAVANGLIGRARRIERRIDALERDAGQAEPYRAVYPTSQHAVRCLQEDCANCPGCPRAVLDIEPDDVRAGSGGRSDA